MLKNDKCLVWNSLIEKLIEIPILRRSRTFAAPSLLLRVVTKTESEKEEKSLDGTYTKIQGTVKCILERQGLMRL